MEESLPKPKSAIMYVWQGINGIMAMFFILAAIANLNDADWYIWFLNDADWYIWFPIYIIPALLAFPIIFKPSLAELSLWTIISVLHFTICCAYALYLMVILIEVIGNNMQNPLQYEVGREMGGLSIIITWLGISRFTNIARPNEKVTNQKLMSALLLMTITLTILPLFVWSLCFVSDWHTRLGHCSGMFK